MRIRPADLLTLEARKYVFDMGYEPRFGVRPPRRCASSSLRRNTFEKHAAEDKASA